MFSHTTRLPRLRTTLAAARHHPKYTRTFCRIDAPSKKKGSHVVKTKLKKSCPGMPEKETHIAFQFWHHLKPCSFVKSSAGMRLFDHKQVRKPPEWKQHVMPFQASPRAAFWTQLAAQNVLHAGGQPFGKVCQEASILDQAALYI
jgi:hypothetical protein